MDAEALSSGAKQPVCEDDHLLQSGGQIKSIKKLYCYYPTCFCVAVLRHMECCVAQVLISPSARCILLP
jgi:hypothetical protein